MTIQRLHLFQRLVKLKSQILLFIRNTLLFINIIPYNTKIHNNLLSYIVYDLHV